MKAASVVIRPLGSRVSLGSPGGAAADHGVADDEELAHAGYDCDHPGLLSSNEPLIESPDDGIAVDGADRGHIQGTPHSCPTASNHPLSSQRAAVARHRGEANQGGHLLVAQLAEL